MAEKFRVSDEVRDVLRRSTVETAAGGVFILRLPEGQLPRPLYVATDKMLKTAGGKWNKNTLGHEFQKDPRPALDMAVEKGEGVNMKNVLQAFYTPLLLAKQVVELCEIETGDVVLEPSAGHGALAVAACAKAGPLEMKCYDINPEAVAALKMRGFDAEVADFLSIVPERKYDRVVMNPPFTKGQDMAHVMHAAKFLKVGGTLVAITSAGAGNGASTKHLDYCNFLAAHLADETPVPAGTFKESGTNIATTIMSLVYDPARPS